MTCHLSIKAANTNDVVWGFLSHFALLPWYEEGRLVKQFSSYKGIASICKAHRFVAVLRLASSVNAFFYDQSKMMHQTRGTAPYIRVHATVAPAMRMPSVLHSSIRSISYSNILISQCSVDRQRSALLSVASPHGSRSKAIEPP